MYDIMVTHIARVMDQPCMVANPARGQLDRENSYLFPSPRSFAPENLVSRDGFGSPVPHHLHNQAESGVYLRDTSPISRRRPSCHYLF